MLVTAQRDRGPERGRRRAPDRSLWGKETRSALRPGGSPACPTRRQTCPDALVHPLRAPLRAASSTPALWRRRAGSGGGRALPPAEDSPSRRDHPTSLHRRRSGVPRSCWPAALPGPVEELLGGPGHARQVAPRALEASAQASVPPARPPSTGFLDQAPDPSTRSRKPEVGLPPDQRRTPEARHRRLGHDHRHGVSPRRPRPGAAAERTDLDAVPEAAGLGLLSPGAPSEEQEALQELVPAPRRERLAPLSEDRDATENDEPIHAAPSVPKRQLIPTVGALPHPATPAPACAGTRARDGPAMAA